MSDNAHTSLVSDIFRPIRTRRAFEEVSGEIKRLVFEGVLKPGDRLPSESELAARFNVGRQTIREALRLLEVSGLISVQKGSGGAVVVDTLLATISNLFLDAFQMKRVGIDELTAARLDIEKVVLAAFIKQAGEADIRGLEENIAQAQRKIDERVQPFDLNVQFHKLIAKGSKNYVHVIVIESITAVVADFRSLFGMDLAAPALTVREHAAILDAVRERDEAAAMGLMERHLLRVGEHYKGLVAAGRGKRHTRG